MQSVRYWPEAPLSHSSPSYSLPVLLTTSPPRLIVCLDTFRIGLLLGYGLENSLQFVSKGAKKSPVDEVVQEIKNSMVSNHSNAICPFPMVYFNDGGSLDVATRNLNDAFEID